MENCRGLDIGDTCPGCGNGALVDEGTGEFVVCNKCGDEWLREGESGLSRKGMKVAMGTWEFSDSFRRVIADRIGKPGLASRAECRRFAEALCETTLEGQAEE